MLIVTSLQLLALVYPEIRVIIPSKKLLTVSSPQYLIDHELIHALEHFNKQQVHILLNC